MAGYSGQAPLAPAARHLGQSHSAVKSEDSAAGQPEFKHPSCENWVSFFLSLGLFPHLANGDDD